jgi:hypothetical protein
MTRAQVRMASIGWRIKELPLQNRDSPVNRALAPAGNAGEGIQGSFAERLTKGRLERRSEAGNHSIDVNVIIRCCHETASMKW